MQRPAMRLACRSLLHARGLLSCRHASTTVQTPMRWIYFPEHLPYELALAMQEQLVATRVEALQKLEGNPSLDDPVVRKAAETDILLLLQHKPVYTAGRRETDEAMLSRERERLRAFGADYVSTDRGGQTTYHGPGQLVGYPIFNMGATGMRTRAYVCLIEKFLDKLLARYEIPVVKSPHVGTFVDANSKIASIGIQIRHRVTMHGFALNVEDSIQKYFGNIVACGLTDVHATSMNTVRRQRGAPSGPLTVQGIVPAVVEEFGRSFDRDMEPFELEESDALAAHISPLLKL